MTLRIFLLFCYLFLSGQLVIAQPDVSEKKDTSGIVIIPDQAPNFPGDLYVFLGENFIYPKSALSAKITGRVVVSFIVEKDGSISNINIISKEIGFGLEEEAKRLVSLMPRWKPGVSNGEFVRVRMTLPIKFGL